MNILYLCHRIPYPPNKGDKIRSFNEVKYLSKKHKIYLAFLIDDEKDLPYVNELKKYCESIDYDFIRPGWQKIKSLPYLLSRKPFTVPYFYSKKLQKAVDYRLSTIKFDAVFAFSSPMAEYVFKSKAISNNNTQIRLIMDFVDVDSDKWRMYAEFNPFPFSLIYKREWKMLMEYEIEVGKSFDCSIFVSEKEVELFESFCPDTEVVSIPNGVDLEFYRQTLSPQSSPLRVEGKGDKVSMEPNILFIGAMDYFPNEDAVLHFAQEIWPYVKEKLPHAKFYVVGGKPSRRVRILQEKDPHIIVTGYTPDIRPYLCMADVFVAPIRIARGVQNKVLEAMAAGIPIVASPEAIQGLSGYNGCLKVKESDGGFASSIIEIIQDKNKKQEMIKDSLRFIMEKHNWEENLKKFEKIIE